MNDSFDGRRAVVIGGGWSGVAAAWHLRRAGARVDLVDDQPSTGGRSRSVALGERRVTLGGKNIGTKYTRFRTFVAEHDGGPWEHFGISTSQIENGKRTAIEGSRRGQSTLRLLSRARPVDIARLVRYAHAIKTNPSNRFLGGPAFRRATWNGERPLSDVFGAHLTEHLIRPMTIRMNGAEPDEAFLGNFGTNLALVLDSFDQLRDGFDQVLDHFEQTISVHHCATVTEIHHDQGKVRGVSFRRDDGTEGRLDADIVVVAVPASAAANLMRSLDHEAANALEHIPYHPVGVVVAEYDRDVFGETGRALIFPHGHLISNAGAYGNNDRRTVRYTFSGRTARALLVTGPSTDELLAIGEKELGTHLPLAGAKAVHAVSRVWEQGLCSYGRNPRGVGQNLINAGGRIRGLTFAGDYIAGASIEACFVSAEHALSRVSMPRATAVR